MGSTTKAAERKVIIDLTELLKKNSDRLLSGETNLCLTTSSLSVLAVNFRRFSENTGDIGEAESSRDAGQRSKKKDVIDLKTWQDNVRTLIDFVWKVKALKIIHGTYTMKAPVQIYRFRSLQILELKRVPIHMVEGLSKLRGQLREITVSKSLQTLKDLLEICGGDRTPGLVWPYLKTAYFSFNTLKDLDESLNFIPFVEVIDLSHNSIAKTEGSLQNLLDLKRINLGYNLLKSVPQFSSVNKLKIKTLVLRSNSLENLDGIEDLVALEELDVSENFLLDHMVLQGLMALKRLQVLCLVGNPLCFKTDHRLLTLQHIYPQAGLGVFLLDGKRLTNHEVGVLQDYQYRYNSEISNGASTSTLVVKEPDSTITVSQLTPHSIKKKHGHKRKRSKERLPKIVNIEDSFEENLITKSSGNSPSTSYGEESEIDTKKQEEDEKYYETLRNYYKDDWLYALSAKQSDLNQKKQLGLAKNTFDFDKNDKREKENSRENGASCGTQNLKSGEKELPKEENLFTSKFDDTDRTVIDEVIHVEVSSPLTSPITSDPKVSVKSPTSPECVEIGRNTDIYSLPKHKSHRSNDRTETQVLHHMYSYDVVDAPTSVKEDNMEMYDTICEEFIMMLPDDEMNQLIVTVNERFIIERDLSGNTISTLDLKSLKKISKTEERCYGKDIIGGCLFIILTLDFDYVLKEKRQRRYAVESENEAQRFESVTSVYIQSNEVEKDYMQCLKCQHEFAAESQDEMELTKCPRCQSKMVIKSGKVKIPVGQINEDNQVKGCSDTSTTHSPKRSSVWRRSTIRRKRKEECSDDTVSVLSDEQRVSMSDLDVRNSQGTSLKDYVDQLIPDVPKDLTTDDTKEGFTEPSQSVKANRKSMTEISSLKSNTSWSDVQKCDISKSGTRGSVSSVDSDITVLVGNSSRGSIAVISESMNEQVQSSVTSTQEHEVISGIKNNTGHVTSGNEVLADDTEITWMKHGERLLTPVGSPLSNSVCSSMVSSVYENTVSGTAEDVSASGDDYQVQDENIAESVPIRRSKKNEKSRRSDNRNFTFFDDRNFDTVDGDVSVNVESTVNNPSEKEKSIYDSADLSDTKYANVLESSALSIYDTSVSDTSVGTSHHDSVSIYSDNSRQSHDDSPYNQIKSEHSSLRRRRSRSRSRSQNRSAVYIDDEKDVIKISGAGAPEFPSELSPIQKTTSGRESRQDQSSSSMDENNKLSCLKNESSKIFSPNLDENTPKSDSIQQSCSSIQLPWEENEDPDKPEKSKRDDCLNHDEFVNIDHKIKLHLELQVFNAEETVQCAIQCDIVQYMKEEAIKSLLVISTHRIIIFRIGEESASSTDWLKAYENQPITELRYIDIGLGYQTLRLEFETECSSYTLLIADEGKCKRFLTLISEIVAHSDHSHLEGIGKANPTTYNNLESQVLKADDDSSFQHLVTYLMLTYTHTDTDEMVKRSLAVTDTDLVLIDENHQWPLPRLQAPLEGVMKKQQFSVVQREKINNIGKLSFNEFNPKELQLSFIESTAPENASIWTITFETMKGVKSFVDAIRGPWEEEFGISLDITSVSFTDSEQSSVI